ncbi:MAG: alpha/beta hydrolase family esterase [Thermoanaerobaculia bacterium]
MKRAVALLLLCVVPVLTAAKRRAARSGFVNPLGGRELARFVMVDGIRHDFYVYLPSSYDGVRALPLLLSFHGGGGDAVQGERTVNLRSTAEKRGFILVRPEGYDASGLGLRTWNAGACCSGAIRDGVDHVAAVRAILDRVEDEWRIDAGRVYATGHSNGGMMVYRLACELSDRIAAIAPNAAYLVDKDLDADPPRELFRCEPSRPVPVMHMHGDADTCSPMVGGRSTGFEPALRPPVADSIARFVAINQAATIPRVSYQNGDVTCVTYDGPQADVVLCTARGGGHAWPGASYSARTKRNCGGNAIDGMNANDAIWDFFMVQGGDS